MAFGPTPLPIPEGTRYETNQRVERLDFEKKDGGGTFIVLHFEAPVAGRATSIRAPIAREVYEAHTDRSS